MTNELIDIGYYPPNLEAWQYKERQLWYLGNIDLLGMPLVSVIGSRGVGEVGKSRTQRITKILVEAGYCVVSGLAKGVDTVAHKTALELGGYTIAVMGTPIDQCYPKENRELKNEIAKRGLVISQFPSNHRVFPSNFPLRNTLMAALSEATIVVEAGERSGTRHQVKSAVEMNRKVGFLASMAERNISWVNEALGSGHGFIISEPADLFQILNGGIKNKKPEQLQFDIEPLSDEADPIGTQPSVREDERFWTRVSLYWSSVKSLFQDKKN